MGIINVTPDSFSDGGETFMFKDAVQRGLAMLESGADMLDIGGESTRPGATPVSVDEEMHRVVPVIEKLCDAGAIVSIDSRRSQVMRAAINAGASVVNDVTALAGDPYSLACVADCEVSVILMHMQGTPETMQDRPNYDDVCGDVHDYLGKRIDVCAEAGIPRERIAVDPGIGFGKTCEHNLQILSHIEDLHRLRVPVIIGASRKSFIGRISGETKPAKRTAGSISAALASLNQGVQIFRVHDVAETRQAFDVWEAIRSVV